MRDVTTGRPEEMLRDANANPIPILGFDFDNAPTPLAFTSAGVQRFGPLESGIYFVQAFGLTGNTNPYMHVNVGTGSTSTNSSRPILGVSQQSQLNHPTTMYIKLLSGQTHIVFNVDVDDVTYTHNIKVICLKVI